MKIKQLYKVFSRQQLKIVLLAVCVSGIQAALFSQSAEYTLKAVAFEKLSLFIDWKATAIQDNSSKEFVIAVFGKNPFGNTLKEVYENKKIKDKTVRIIYAKSIKDLTNCQILFISKTNKSELQKVLNYIKGRPILTISDTEGFAEAGCCINFYNFENKLRFEINQKRMIDAGFAIDYRLLRVSKILNPTTQ
jgi:hypothetical protein